MTLDYRSAGSASSDDTPESRLIGQLQQLYAVKTGGGVLLMLAGAGIILLAGVVVTSIVTFILYTWFDSSFLGWTGWFVVYLIAIVPLLVREERRSRGHFLSEAAAGLDNPMDASSYGEYQLDRGAAMTAVYSEMLLWGPRALLRGIATMRGQQPTRFRGLLERAAQVILTLYRSPDAMLLAKLIQPGEPPARFREVLKWLDDQDYIGLSSDGKRVWLSSRMRGKLASEGY
jgi:hypothetical protein